MIEIDARASARRPAVASETRLGAVSAQLADFRERMGLGLPLDPELQMRREAELWDMTRDRLLAEYRRYGLDPVFTDKTHVSVVALSMLRHLGWTIGVIGRNKFELRKPADRRRA